MKNLILLLLPILLFSCTSKPKELPVLPTKTTPIKTYFYFGAVNFSNENIYGNREHKFLVGEIIETPFMNQDDKYRLLDKLSSSVYITMERNYRIEDRQVYSFSSYSEASIKRQEVLKTGIQ